MSAEHGAYGAISSAQFPENSKAALYDDAEAGHVGGAAHTKRSPAQGWAVNRVVGSLFAIAVIAASSFAVVQQYNAPGSSLRAIFDEADTTDASGEEDGTDDPYNHWYIYKVRTAHPFLACVPRQLHCSSAVSVYHKHSHR